jgi:hypothetical protein
MLSRSVADQAGAAIAVASPKERPCNITTPTCFLSLSVGNRVNSSASSSVSRPSRSHVKYFGPKILSTSDHAPAMRCFRVSRGAGGGTAIGDGGKLGAAAVASASALVGWSSSGSGALASVDNTSATSASADVGG